MFAHYYLIYSEKIVIRFLLFYLIYLSFFKTVVCVCALVLITNATESKQPDAQAIDESTNAEGSDADGEKNQEKRDIDRHAHDYHVHEQKTITILKKVPVPYPVEKHIPVECIFFIRIDWLKMCMI